MNVWGPHATWIVRTHLQWCFNYTIRQFMCNLSAQIYLKKSNLYTEKESDAISINVLMTIKL